LRLYLDTSVFVSALCDEAMTAQVLGFLHDHASDQFLTSAWSFTEFASAIALKIRTGQLKAEHRSRLTTRLTQLVSAQVDLIGIVDEDYHRAARFCDDWASGLPSGDSLHLAVAFSSADAIVTLDKGLHRAAQHFGITATIP
jgi:predicted nucleic acid-binding protein